MPRNLADNYINNLAALREGGCRDAAALGPRVSVINVPRERVVLAPEQPTSLFSAIRDTVYTIAGRKAPSIFGQCTPDAAVADGRGGWEPQSRRLRGGDPLREAALQWRSNPTEHAIVLPLLGPEQNALDRASLRGAGWLTTLVSGGRLHMCATTVRSSIFPIMSAEGPFGWSVIQEMMAYWTRTEVGCLVHFTGSLNRIDHGPDGPPERVLSSATSPYELGYGSMRFRTELEDLDHVLGRWIDLESALGAGRKDVLPSLREIPDPFLQACLVTLYIGAFGASGTRAELGSALDLLPPSDFRLAAAWHLARVRTDWQNLSLAESERVVVGVREQLAEMSSGEDQAGRAYQYQSAQDLSGTVAYIAEQLKVLHFKKTLVYGDSWKKHGEVIGVFANISRKYDRLEAVLGAGARPTADEPILDTLADLTVYAGKYITYLAEHEPESVAEFINRHASAERVECYQGNAGFDHVLDLLLRRSASLSPKPADTAACLTLVEESFARLEVILLGGAEVEARNEKPRFAATLALACLNCLAFLAAQDPVTYRRFCLSIDNL